jgi:membrane protein
MGRVQYWKRSRLVRRLHAADVINQGLLLAAVLLLTFLPFLLVIESLGDRNDASSLIRRFGLSGEAAEAVRRAFTSPAPPSTAVNGLSWVFFILFGFASAGAIQGLYERVFGVHGRGLRDAPRRAVWLAAALGVTFAGAWTQPWLDRVGGPGLVAIAALPVATAFWWFSMWLFLGTLGWRALLPSALATGICWLGMVIFFRLTLSSTITSDYRKYGPAGVVFAIMPLLIAIGVVILLGALLGVAWRERHEHPPGEQPSPSAEREQLQRRASVWVQVPDRYGQVKLLPAEGRPSAWRGTEHAGAERRLVIESDLSLGFLRITGVDRPLNIHPSLDAALSSAMRRQPPGLPAAPKWVSWASAATAARGAGRRLA